MQSISYDHVHLRITYGILVDTPMVMFSHRIIHQLHSLHYLLDSKVHNASGTKEAEHGVLHPYAQCAFADVLWTALRLPLA